jgi:hypothetical protein
MVQKPAVSPCSPFEFQIRIIPGGRTRKEKAGIEKKYGEQNTEKKNKKTINFNCTSLRRILTYRDSLSVDDFEIGM